MEFYDFPNVVGMMIQSDFHIFQGVETTNQNRDFPVVAIKSCSALKQIEVEF